MTECGAIADVFTTEFRYIIKGNICGSIMNPVYAHVVISPHESKARGTHLVTSIAIIRLEGIARILDISRDYYYIHK